jgi:hypothetical protein
MARATVSVLVGEVPTGLCFINSILEVGRARCRSGALHGCRQGGLMGSAVPPSRAVDDATASCEARMTRHGRRLDLRLFRRDALPDLAGGSTRLSQPPAPIVRLLVISPYTRPPRERLTWLIAVRALPPRHTDLPGRRASARRAAQSMGLVRVWPSSTLIRLPDEPEERKLVGVPFDHDFPADEAGSSVFVAQRKGLNGDLIQGSAGRASKGRGRRAWGLVVHIGRSRWMAECLRQGKVFE